MGCVASKAPAGTVDKAVDTAAAQKDKVVAGVKTAGEKVGVNQAAVDGAAAKVDQALSDPAALKAKLGGGAAATEASAEQAAAPVVEEVKAQAV